MCTCDWVFTCRQATLGGSTSPMSSPWTMVRTPMVLVVIPHEFWKASCFSPGLLGSSNTISNILEKFWPRWWDVAPWGKGDSCFNAMFTCLLEQEDWENKASVLPEWLGRWQRWMPPRLLCNLLLQISPSQSSSLLPQGWPLAPHTPWHIDPGFAEPAYRLHINSLPETLYSNMSA